MRRRRRVWAAAGAAAPCAAFWAVAWPEVCAVAAWPSGAASPARAASVVVAAVGTRGPFSFPPRARCTSANVARARRGAQSFCKPAARLAARTAATAAGVVGRWKRWSGGMAALPLRRGGSRVASRGRGGSQRSGSAGEGQPAGVQQTPALNEAIMVVLGSLKRCSALPCSPYDPVCFLGKKRNPEEGSLSPTHLNPARGRMEGAAIPGAP